MHAGAHQHPPWTRLCQYLQVLSLILRGNALICAQLAKSARLHSMRRDGCSEGRVISNFIDVFIHATTTRFFVAQGGFAARRVMATGGGSGGGVKAAVEVRRKGVDLSPVGRVRFFLGCPHPFSYVICRPFVAPCHSLNWEGRSLRCVGDELDGLAPFAG